jgi:transcriptional regulator with XRE-family HTH domain
MSPRSHSLVVEHAARLLGAQIRAGRAERGWTAKHLAELVGVTERTVRNVERGGLGVALGTTLDCAWVVGVTLFYEDEQRLAAEAERASAALIGKRVRPRAADDVDLDF